MICQRGRLSMVSCFRPTGILGLMSFLFIVYLYQRQLYWRTAYMKQAEKKTMVMTRVEGPTLDEILSSGFVDKQNHTYLKPSSNVSEPITTSSVQVIADHSHSSPQHKSHPQCTSPVTSVFYVKVHKTASSTMSTLLYQFAHHHNLTIVPISHDPYPGRDPRKALVKDPNHKKKKLTYDIFAEHCVFDEDLWRTIASPDVVFIASIRHPLPQLRSYINEFHLGKQMTNRKVDPVVEMLTHQENYTGMLAETKSMMLKEFGLRGSEIDSAAKIDEMIDMIDRTFTQVLISEFFIESLIMLRRKLCWEVRDIVFTELRKRPYKHKDNVPDQTMIELHRNMSSGDYILYDYFSKRLFEEIRHESEDFWDELYQYRTISTAVAGFCAEIVDRLKASTKVIYTFLEDMPTLEFNPEPWGKSFTVNAIDCALMELRTRVHRNILKVRQMPSVCQAPNRQASHLIYDIVWKDRETVSGNSLYCSEWNTQYDVPVKLLADRGAYMWID